MAEKFFSSKGEFGILYLSVTVCPRSSDPFYILLLGHYMVPPTTIKITHVFLGSSSAKVTENNDINILRCIRSARYWAHQNFPSLFFLGVHAGSFSLMSGSHHISKIDIL